MKTRDPSWFIGLVGFSYPEWSRTFYAGHALSRSSRAAGKNHLLHTYSGRFNAVEINTTFYNIPSAETARTWSGATPADFRFSAKMPRDVTHGPTPPGAPAAPDGSPPGHLLQDDTLAIARRFIESLQPLSDKLGAVLMQFPPRFAADRREELATFLDRLASDRPLVVELRHDSWWTSDTAAMLRDRNVSWAATDESSQRDTERATDSNGAGTRAPRPIMATADILYIRWLGRHGQFTDRSKEHFDPSPRLRWWTDRLHETLDRNPCIRTVYGFFDNDFAGHAPATARRFADMIGFKPPGLAAESPDEPTLFG